MQAIHTAVIQSAVQLGLEDGQQLRVDTTVVETDIHFPTDATLLWDTVRTVTRLVEDLPERLPRGVQASPIAPAGLAAAGRPWNG